MSRSFFGKNNKFLSFSFFDALPPKIRGNPEHKPEAIHSAPLLKNEIGDCPTDNLLFVRFQRALNPHGFFRYSRCFILFPQARLPRFRISFVRELKARSPSAIVREAFCRVLGMPILRRLRTVRLPRFYTTCRAKVLSV